MPRFSYRARDVQGNLVQGVVDSADRAGAIHLIEQKGCLPFRIESDAAAQSSAGAATAVLEAPGAKRTASAVFSGNASQSKSRSLAPPARNEGLTSRSDSAPGASARLNHAQRLFFTEQLAYLLTAGMTLDEALGVLVRRLKQPALQTLTKSLHRSLLDGRSFSQALRDYPRIFSPLYVNLVLAGEASGALTDILSRLVKHLTNMKVLRDRVQQSLIYPAFLSVAGVALVILFITVMVPQLESFFANTNGGKLPLPTQALISANNFLVRYWWAILAAFAAVYSIFKAFTRTPEGLMKWDRARLLIPGYGAVIKYQFYAQFARTLSTLLQNGVTLLKAIELLEDMSGNVYLKAKLVDARAALVEGANLSKALAKDDIFPELFLDMMAVGEQSGRFAETMQMIADVYERELDQRVKIASSIIPPIIIVVIALMVGAVVFGIMSAVFSITSGLQTRMHS